METFNQFSSQDGDLTLGRRAKIIEMIDRFGQVKVTELSRIFNVSEVTIRNDLEQLEGKGLLIRTRGGGLKTERVKIDYQFSNESKLHYKEKQAIGKKAAELVSENDSIILDSGSTTQEVAQNLLQFHHLTIITNALNIASFFVNKPNIKVVMLGGILKHSSLSLIGPMAEKGIKNLYCDKVFLGVNGIDSKHGISTTNIEDAYLNQLMINISNEVIVVTDSSKFLNRSFATISPITEIDVVITDSKIPKEELKNLQNVGVKTVVV
jgi:DeoR family transcriptional regulator of aga operon